MTALVYLIVVAVAYALGWLKGHDAGVREARARARWAAERSGR